MKFRYSYDYFPPAPVVDVSFIAAAEFTRAGPFSAIVDSGADGSIVPLDILDAINAPPTVEVVM